MSTSGASASAASTATFAANPVGNDSAASVPLPARQLGLELLVVAAVADHEARGAGAEAPLVEGDVGGLHHRGVRGQPQVVVRRERHDLAALERDLREPTPSRARSARHRPPSRMRLEPAGDPLRPGHRITRPRRRRDTSAMASATVVDDPVDLVGGGGEHRHEHDHVAQRPDQHAALHAAGRHPAAPAQPVRRAGPARCRPSGRAGAPRPRPAAAPTSAASASASCSARSRTLASTSHSSIRLEVAERDGGGEGVPAVGVPVVQRALRQVRRRGTPRTPTRWPRWPTAAGSRR